MNQYDLRGSYLCNGKEFTIQGELTEFTTGPHTVVVGTFHDSRFKRGCYFVDGQVDVTNGITKLVLDAGTEINPPTFVLEKVTPDPSLAGSYEGFRTAYNFKKSTERDLARMMMERIDPLASPRLLNSISRRRMQLTLTPRH